MNNNKYKKPIIEVEQIFGIKLERNKKSLGLDIATHTGYCLIETTDKDLIIKDYGFINIENNKKQSELLYDIYIDYFKKLIEKEYIVVIEDTFLKKYYDVKSKKWKANVWSFKMLTRIGSIAYVIAKEKGSIVKPFTMATSARSNLNFNGKASKSIIVKNFKNKLKIDLENLDIIDSIILAINGVLC